MWYREVQCSYHNEKKNEMDGVKEHCLSVFGSLLSVLSSGFDLS